MTQVLVQKNYHTTVITHLTWFPIYVILFLVEKEFPYNTILNLHYLRSHCIIKYVKLIGKNIALTLRITSLLSWRYISFGWFAFWSSSISVIWNLHFLFKRLCRIEFIWLLDGIFNHWWIDSMIFNVKKSRTSRFGSLIYCLEINIFKLF